MEKLYPAGKYDVVVLGAGHAGSEASLACARMGLETLCLTLNPDSVALMACNPAIGGTSKGHLVREVDALGGEMGLAADDTLIQIRMLNTGKGPAVQSLRAQMDKRRYHERMKRALECQPKLSLRLGECERILVENGRVCGVVAAGGGVIECRAVVVAAGVYLKSRILIGDHATDAGPSGLMRANALSDSLLELGFVLRRFKTGTPARVMGRSLDYSLMSIQEGDEPPPRFSFISHPRALVQRPCYLTYTNERTHAIIRENITRSAMYSGLITGTGARYCPSIEDKVTRFADKDRHQLFIEPEGESTDEMYVQGMSTSLPYDVQLAMLRTIPGLERCEMVRPGYAIEYDCIDSSALDASLMSKSIPGLFFAGQINGSSGYEEAAAQGLYAGINCGLYLRSDAPLLLTRADAYIGVLVDDLVTKGTDEPYRMMTSRAEYRLLLRQDNADMRLTELALRTGLISDARYAELMRRRDGVARAHDALVSNTISAADASALLSRLGEAPISRPASLFALLKRQSVRFTDLLSLCAELDGFSPDVMEELEVMARYDGYIDKQRRQVERFVESEAMLIPRDVDYASIGGLRIEARQKLAAARPENIGRASRIPGVSPADISVLLVWLKANSAL